MHAQKKKKNLLQVPSPDDSMSSFAYSLNSHAYLYIKTHRAKKKYFLETLRIELNRIEVYQNRKEHIKTSFLFFISKRRHFR